VEETVQAVDNSGLLPHAEGEVFKSGKARLARLQGYALHKGVGVVTITSNATRFRFGCIHQRDESKNWHDVEDVIVPTAPLLAGEP
jgi:hypothetical protein